MADFDFQWAKTEPELAARPVQEPVLMTERKLAELNDALYRDHCKNYDKLRRSMLEIINRVLRVNPSRGKRPAQIQYAMAKILPDWLN